jgi:DNA-binding SARP family transcriptional activator/nucleoid-associated protein YgaU
MSQRRAIRPAAALRALGAAAALATLLVALPVALLALGADPIAVRLPTLRHAWQVLTRPDDGTVLIVIVRIAAWAGWLLFALSTVAEMIAVVVGRTVPALRGIAALHQPAAYLVAAIVAALPVSTSTAAVAAPAAGSPDRSPQHSAPAHVPAPRQPPPTPVAPPAGSGNATPVMVERYDSLWKLAEQHLGTGQRWHEIYQLNRGRPQPGGRTLTDPAHIEPGWTLLIPAEQPKRHRMRYEVAPGDQLGAIAARFLGAAGHYPEIAAINPDLVNGRHDADHIEPGWQLTLPAEAHDRGPGPHAAGTLATGETTTRQREPTQPRPPRPPRPSLPSPHPTAPDQRPSPTTTAPPGGPTAPSRPSPRATTTPGTLPGPSAPATPRTPVPTAATGRPPTSAVPTPSRAPTPERPSTPESPSVEAHHSKGVDLPGGWVTVPLAAALAGAGSLVWLRRRRRYIPGPIARPAADDPDLRPLPPAVAALRRGTRQQGPDLPHPEPPPQPTVRDAARAPEPPTPSPTGPDGPTLAGFGPLPPGGLGLTGPGAEAAIRGLLVATLTAGGPSDPDARGTVLIPTRTLTTLLGEPSPPATPRLHVVADLTDALAYAGETLIERHRLLDGYDSTDLTELHQTKPFHEPMPPVLLITEPPTAEAQPDLAATINQGTPVALNAVILGEWAAGKTVSVALDGTTDNDETATDPDRVTVLDQQTTRDLLDVLREANETGAPPAEPLLEPAPAAETPAPGNTQTANRRVQIRLFGTPRILDPTGTAVPGLRHHAAGLLLYLAIHRDGAQLPDIMEAFWPTATLRRASERLSTEVANLRRTIRTAAGNTKIQPVINTGGHYHLNPDVLTIDLWTLTDATTDTTDLRPLSAAVDAYTAPLAETFDYDWLEQHREHARRQAITALLRLAEATDAEDAAAQLGFLDRASDLDPYSEDLARRTILAANRAEDTAAASRRYERLRTALADLDEEPSFTLAELTSSQDGP